MVHNIDSDHKDLFPMDSNDAAGLVLGAIGLIIAAGGGIGGGGILVPLFILVMKFKAKHAIPLSNVAILGSAIINTIFNLPQRHPKANRPLVDWDLILAMEPLTIFGAVVGAYVNKVLPEYLLVSMLVLLLTATAIRTLKKGVKLFRKETAAFERLGEDNSKISEVELGDTQIKKRLDLDDIDNFGDAPTSTSVAVKGAAIGGNPAGLFFIRRKTDPPKATPLPNTPGSPTLEKDQYEDTSQVMLDRILLEESRTVPVPKLLLLLLLFAGVMCLTVLKGGGHVVSPIGVTCGSAHFWLLSIMALPWVLGFSSLVRCYLLRLHHIKEVVGYPYVEGDIQWTPRATIIYPAICSGAGLCAGLFGIGGGIVKGPLMLELGVLPQVASATSACMILYTAASACSMFYVFGLLKVDYAACAFTLGVLSSIIGQFVMKAVMKRYKRNSVIVFLIGGVVAVSAVFMGIEGISNVVEDGIASHAESLCARDGQALNRTHYQGP